MFLLLLIIFLFAPHDGAFAETYTKQKIGNFDFVSGPNGYSGSGQQIGGTYYYHDNQSANTSADVMSSAFNMGLQGGTSLDQNLMAQSYDALTYKEPAKDPAIDQKRFQRARRVLEEKDDLDNEDELKMNNPNAKSASCQSVDFWADFIDAMRYSELAFDDGMISIQKNEDQFMKMKESLLASQFGWKKAENYLGDYLNCNGATERRLVKDTIEAIKVWRMSAAKLNSVLNQITYGDMELLKNALIEYKASQQTGWKEIITTLTLSKALAEDSETKTGPIRFRIDLDGRRRLVASISDKFGKKIENIKRNGNSFICSNDADLIVVVMYFMREYLSSETYEELLKKDLMPLNTSVTCLDRMSCLLVESKM